MTVVYFIPIIFFGGIFCCCFCCIIIGISIYCTCIGNDESGRNASTIDLPRYYRRRERDRRIQRIRENRLAEHKKTLSTSSRKNCTEVTTLTMLQYCNELRKNNEFVLSKLQKDPDIEVLEEKKEKFSPGLKDFLESSQNFTKLDTRLVLKDIKEMKENHNCECDDNFFKGWIDYGKEKINCYFCLAIDSTLYIYQETNQYMFCFEIPICKIENFVRVSQRSLGSTSKEKLFTRFRIEYRKSARECIHNFTFSIFSSGNESKFEVKLICLLEKCTIAYVNELNRGKLHTEVEINSSVNEDEVRFGCEETEQPQMINGEIDEILPDENIQATIEINPSVNQDKVKIEEEENEIAIEIEEEKNEHPVMMMEVVAPKINCDILRKNEVSSVYNYSI